MELKPHQIEAAEFLRHRKNAILADPPRLGKTYPTIMVALEIQAERGGCILIVAPSSAKFVWRDAVRLFDTSVAITVVKTVADVKAGLPKGFNGVFIVPWGLLKDMPPTVDSTVLILDECHRMQSEKAQRTKAALRLMKTAARIFALSGTLMNNRPINLWALLTGLKINKRSWYDFAIHFARGWVAPWGFDTSGASNLPELKALVAPHLLRRSKQSVFKNYTPPEFRLVTFDRPVNKRESQFDINQLAELENPILSIEGLSEIVHETARKKLPDAIDFISGMLDEEPDTKLVVFAYHTDIIDALAAGLKLYRPVTVKGATSPEMREARRNIFMTKSQCRLFIGNIICCAEAIDLSIADTCVFVETTWVPSLLEQAAARVENLGKNDSATLAYLLTIETSLDHHILKRVLQKLSTIKKVIPNESKPLAPRTRATTRATRCA